MKVWCNNIEQLREAYKMAAEDMTEDQKPRCVDIKIVKDTRNNAINSVLHIVIRQIRKHLFKAGMGYVEYEDEFTGKRVRMPLDDAMVKDIVKQELGTKIVAIGTSIAKPTRLYSQDEMVRTLRRIEAWASTDLNLQIVYKEKLKAIDEKYREQDD